MQYLFNLIVAGDIFLMALFGGKRNETLSAAAWSLEQSGHFFGFWRPVIDWFLLWRETDHCHKQWLIENPERKS